MHIGKENHCPRTRNPINFLGKAFDIVKVADHEARQYKIGRGVRDRKRRAASIE
jgi:hypothetical protein